jgi:hypothetical protein
MNLGLAPAVTEVDGQVQLDWAQADPFYEHWLDTRRLLGFYIPDVYDNGNGHYRIRKATRWLADWVTPSRSHHGRSERVLDVKRMARGTGLRSECS